MSHLDKVEHFFVLVLENRSFDHLFGMSGITGTDTQTQTRRRVQGVPPGARQNDAQGNSHAVVNGASTALRQDIGHEFDDVQRQLTSGFIADRGAGDLRLLDAVRCFEEAQLPILHQLAREFVVCDQWFCAVPGPTFPNRMFLHASSSGGIAESPSALAIAAASFSDLLGFNFANGHVFAHLNRAKVPWALYVHSLIENMSVVIDGIHKKDMRLFNRFRSDVSQPTFAPKYVFIEPQYDSIVGHYKNGNSMHPLNDVSKGERLVKEVYEALRASPLWPKSALLVTFDEHGGFFDHVTPETTQPPNDGSTSRHPGFNFDRLGFRVPTLVISPLTERNLVDGRLYHHGTILRTVFERLGLPPITDRDRHARSLADLFTRATARTDAPLTLGAVAAPQSLAAATPDPSGLLEGLQPEAPPEPEELPVSARPFVLAAAAMHARALGPDGWDTVRDRLRALDGASDEAVRQYIEEVGALVGAPAPALPFGAPESVGPGLESLAPDESPEARAQRALADANGDRPRAAWSLGISQWELDQLAPRSPA